MHTYRRAQREQNLGSELQGKVMMLDGNLVRYRSPSLSMGCQASSVEGKVYYELDQVVAGYVHLRSAPEKRRRSSQP